MMLKHIAKIQNTLHIMQRGKSFFFFMKESHTDLVFLGVTLSGEVHALVEFRISGVL